jgi:hypothetical protein
VPLVLSASQTFVVAEFTAEPEPTRRCQCALQDEAKPPDVGKADLAKAKQVAKNYGERPWLFMRYDVRLRGVDLFSVSKLTVRISSNGAGSVR